MSFAQAVTFANGWKGIKYIYKCHTGYDWDIFSHGSADVYVLFN